MVGFVACCVTLKTLGIGPHEQNWAAVKNIKTGKRVNLGGDLLEKQTVLYALAPINHARSRSKLTDNIESSKPNAYFILMI